jgi:tetraacyldisaccharide-1-P 4'-kinase
VPIRVPTKFNELGLLRLQGQTEFTQPLGERFLSAKSIRTKLETQHEVINISHHAGLTTKSRFDHSLEPQVEHIVKIYIAQQYADHAPYTKANFQFERTLKGWRTGYPVLDLQRKG